MWRERAVAIWNRLKQSHRTTPKPRILAVMTSEADRLCLRHAAERLAFESAFASSVQESVPLLSTTRFAVIVCDRNLPGLDWQHTLQILSSLSPESCLILVSPVNDEYLWQEVVQRGGYDVLTTPLRDEQVVHTLSQACWYWQSGSGSGNHTFSHGI